VKPEWSEFIELECIVSPFVIFEGSEKALFGTGKQQIVLETLGVGACGIPP
jgi:hypothetical protein